MAHADPDELRIGTVEAGRGRIGMTICPGRNAREFNYDRNLDQDLRAIVDWGASAIVSVIEQSELDRFSLSNLGPKAEALGLDWYHLPVVDVSIPGPYFEALWVYAGHRIRRALMDGESVLIHCRGGLGRTGMVAARLLIELGDSADEAIGKIRAARPGAIETAAQERYVRTCGPVVADPDYADRVLGCILGGAVGDALGYAVEFESWEAIRRRYGADGINDLALHEGLARVSDDTQMTLFTLEGLLRAPRNRGAHVIEEISRAYADWLATQGAASAKWRAAGALWEQASMRFQRAPGNTCLSALRMKQPIADSKGCGGVMRVAPLGLIRDWPAEKAFDLGAAAAALTHGHPTGFLSAGALAAIIRHLLDDPDLLAAARRAESIIQTKQGHEETFAAIEAALNPKVKRRQVLPVGHLGEGWIAEEALAIGLYCAIHGKSFADALVLAANHDGDSDSTASIAGQIYGAAHGVRDLPNRWVRRLDVLIPLLRLIGELLEAEMSA